MVNVRSERKVNERILNAKSTFAAYLVRAIDELPMRRNGVEFVAPMQNCAVPVEKEHKHAKQQVHIHGNEHWVQHERRGAHKLIKRVVGNH